MTIVNFDELISSIVAAKGKIDCNMSEIKSICDKYNKENKDVHFELTDAHINWAVNKSDGNITFNNGNITASNIPYSNKHSNKDLVAWIKNNI
jgi:hypothetical protein